MSNNAMEAKVRELVELKKMAAELNDEITALEDEIKAVMGEEEGEAATGFPAGAHRSGLHPDRVRGQQAVEVRPPILRDHGDRQAEAPSAGGHRFHHGRLPQRRNGPHERRVPANGLDIQ